jgi:putative flippase GtrA
LPAAHHADHRQPGTDVHEPIIPSGARRARRRAAERQRRTGSPYTAAVSLVDAVLIRIPQPYRDIAVRHRELVKFAVVGGITYVVDITLFTMLKLTVLEPKPVTAKIVAVLVATMVSYVLNREWSFRTRGGRERHYEASLFFLICGIGLVINATPLWISRYVLDLRVPVVSLLAQEAADFASANVIGTLLAMAFRWWAFRRYVFPDENVRRQVAVPADAG